MSTAPTYAKLVFRAEAKLVATGAEQAGNVRRPTIVRIGGREFLWIPKTTWKGVFRSLAIRLWANRDERVKLLAIDAFSEEAREIVGRYCDDVINVVELASTMEAKRCTRLRDLCDPYTLVARALKHYHETNRFNRIVERIVKQRDMQDPEALQTAVLVLASLSPVGRLFGTQLISARIDFTDTFIPVEALHARYRIGIDRGSGKVRQNVLFVDVAVYAPGTIRTVMRVFRPAVSDDENEAINAVLRYVAEVGIEIGVARSVGLGWLRLDEGSLGEVNKAVSTRCGQ